MCWRIAPMCDCHAVALPLLVPELHSGMHLYRAVVLRPPSIRYIFSMRERYRVTDPGNYFLTMTIVEWVPVFIGVEACNIIVDSLKYCRAHKGLLIRAFVIMERGLPTPGSGGRASSRAAGLCVMQRRGMGDLRSPAFASSFGAAGPERRGQETTPHRGVESAPSSQPTRGLPLTPALSRGERV